MKYEFNKLKMENILKFIEKRGYYYIQTAIVNKNLSQLANKKVSQ